MTITRPVTVQITRVSMKVPIMATVPWATGSSDCAAAWAMGALPSPASLEKMPRATPNWMAATTVAPAKPPAAAVGEKAWVTISPRAGPTWSRWGRITASPPSTYQGGAPHPEERARAA
jgi:hypothetical protein